MHNRSLRRIPLRQFGQQPVQTYPGGYVCMVRDVAYGNRYLLLRLRDPKRLKRRLLDNGNFKTELAYAWHATLADEAEDFLRESLAPDTAQGEWFDLEDEQLVHGAAADYHSHQPTVRASSRSPAAATAAVGARSNRPRSIATAVIALLLLAVLLAPRFDGAPLFGEGNLFQIATASHGYSADRYLKPPRLRINWSGKQVIVRWNEVEGATGYQYRYRVNSAPFTYYQNTRFLRETLAGLDPGDVVKFEARSLRGSFRSNTAHTSIRIPPEAMPTQVAVAAESAAQPETNDMIVSTAQGQSVHVRACPSIRCAVIGRLSHGSELRALEVVPDAHDHTRSGWVRFVHGDRDGFVFSALLIDTEN
ncbi:MAG: SH3 domain-containing protein [Chloroflexi bacterium]|nr:SH3 domain-containing protein [Chloroflexota bacterium]